MANDISDLAIVHDWVELGENPMVGPWAILGVPPTGGAPGLALRIGRDAVIRSHSVIYAGSVIGDGFQCGHGALIREFNEIGDRVSVGSHSVVEHHVKLADGVRIHTGAFIPEFSILDEGAWVGPHVVFTNAAYPLSPDAKSTLRGPHLKRGAKIGANATLLPGVVIGVNSLVGAGAVVVRDVPDGVVVAGHPARVLRPIDDVDAYRILQSTADELAQ
jgi:acetyltransferase-like isoleucine patch superfamily enzyme